MINESVSTSYLKKNKNLISKLVKGLNSVPVTSRGDERNGRWCIYNGYGSIKDGLTKLYPNVKYFKSRVNSISLMVYAKVNVEVHSNSNKVWVGYALSDYRIECDGPNAYLGDVDSLRDIFSEIGDSTSVDILSDKNLLSDILSCMKNLNTASSDLTVDSSYFIDSIKSKRIYNSFDYNLYRELTNLKINLFRANLNELFDKLDDYIEYNISNDFFKDCDRRKNFIPAIEINTDSGSGFYYDSTTPETPRSRRKSFDDISDITARNYIPRTGLVYFAADNNLSRLLYNM